MLVEVGHFQLGPDVNTSAIRFQLTKHQFQQRGFPTAVRANQGNFVTALDLGAEILNQDLAINLVVDVLHFEDNLTRASSLFDLHLRAAHHFTALATFAAHGFQCPHTPFVTGTTRFDPLTDPHLFLRQLTIEFRILELFHAQRFFFIQQILIVVPRVGHQLAAIEIDNPRRHVANKGTVVRDENNGPFEGLEETFQPVNGFNIQVVGRFIEQQHARPADQGAAESRFTQPAAGERGELGVGIEIKLLQHFVNTAVELPQP